MPLPAPGPSHFPGEWAGSKGCYKRDCRYQTSLISSLPNGLFATPNGGILEKDYFLLKQKEAQGVTGQKSAPMRTMQTIEGTGEGTGLKKRAKENCGWWLY